MKRTGTWLSTSAVTWLALSCGGEAWVRQHPHSARTSGDGDWTEATAEVASTHEKPATIAPDGSGAETFRNTYYDFPAEGAGQKDATVFDGACQPIAKVTQSFHDEVCLQGSGRLSTGETISFNRRDCECAAVCPKSQHKICFDKLDPKLFPTGRGATGRPVTPLRSVAVDTALIPLGSVLFIADYAGLPLPNGGHHDGCFRADDRGSRVSGRHVDIFTGDPKETAEFNRLVPSNQGVSVEVGSSKCAALKE